MSEEVKKEENQLNKNAKEYIPTKRRVPEKIEFNLTAKEYKPMPAVEYIEGDEDDEDDEVMEELGNEESEDEDKWFPKYKDCECCQGFVFKCKGETCADLGQCYCKMKDDCDKQVDKEK